MINVVDIYNSVRDLCNKDQKGFVTPEVFTTFAGIAQQNIFNEMFTELTVAKKSRRAAIDPARDKSMYKMVEEDLAYFVRKRFLSDQGIEANITEEFDDEGELINSYDNADVSVSVFNKPSDLSKIISMRTDDSASIQLELVYNVEDIDRILYSRQPRSLNPVTNETDFSSTPIYQSLGGSINIPDIVNCRHFELAEHYKNELIMEIAKMIGVRLRDGFLTTISTQEEKAE